MAIGLSKAEIQQVFNHQYQVEKNAKYIIATDDPGENYLQETDTFDTWFSSGQWPLVTSVVLPTDFMGTLADILPFWISRMIMISLYLKNQVPFKTVYIWSMVTDSKGQKMSKSKGNVINPIELVDKYGADAFRASLLFGIGEGSKVILAEEKVKAMRNYANKIWSIGRFIKLNETSKFQVSSFKFQEENILKIIEELNTEFLQLKKKIIDNLDSYKFSRAFDDLYEFIWHRLADFYIEQLKQAITEDDHQATDALQRTYLDCLVLLHPFMPFVTEVIWKEFKGEDESILNEQI